MNLLKGILWETEVIWCITANDGWSKLTGDKNWTILGGNNYDLTLLLL